MHEAIWFRTVCRQNGIDPTDEQLTRLEQFAKLLLDWNKKINLISRRDEQNFWNSHLLHSVSILFKVRFPQAASIIDLGTGGGLPGIPLKILLPDISITLLDSTQKKIKVVQHILDSLSLSRASAVWGRAEEVAERQDHRAHYDVVVARAVAPLKDLVRWSKPLLRVARERKADLNEGPKGIVRIVRPTLISFKGGNLEGEMRSASRVAKVRSVNIIDLTLEGSIQFETGGKKIVLVTYE